MMRWLWLVMICLAPFPLRAEPIIVTSGEHDGFTRLVITLERAQDWQLARMEDGYRLSLPEANEDYDLSRVGDRIGRTRLAEVRQLPGSSDLRIVAACACHATAFAFRPNIIVVDVKSGAPPDGSPFEKPIPQSTPAIRPVAESPVPTTLALGWNARQSASPPFAVPPVRAPRELGRDLARQIGTAASSGLVELVVPEVDAPSRQDLPQIELHAGPNLDIYPGERSATTLLQPGCPPPEEYAVENWIPAGTTSSNFLRRIAQLLAPETDDPTHAERLSAARLYLYYGFGTEARQILQQLPVSEAQRPLFMAISHIMDGEVPDPDPFDGLAQCRSAVALWSVLARPRLRPAEAIASNEIYQAFSALPPHLRTLLVGPLIDRLREQGDIKTADRLRATTEREATLTGPGYDLAVGRLQIAGRENASAQEALEKAAASPGLAEAEALIALVRLAFDDRAPIPSARLQNIAALETQFTTTPLGQDLRAALVTAYALSGEFHPAAQQLRNTPSARSSFWTLLAERGTSEDMLDFAFTPPEDAASLTLPQDRIRIAGQLSALGFAPQAAQWLTLDGAGSRPPDDARQLALASVYLDLHRPRDALSLMAGAGPEADNLRIRALFALDRKGEADLLHAGRQPSPAILHLYRRDGDWPRVAAYDSAIWSEAAQTYLTTPETPDEGITLAKANAALATAETHRGIVVKLLEASVLPTPSSGTTPASAITAP